MPMAQYKDFADCIRKNQDKSDPKAYCGSIYWKTEGKGKRKLGKTTKGAFMRAAGK